MHGHAQEINLVVLSSDVAYCKVVLTFESEDEIQYSDHSNES